MLPSDTLKATESGGATARLRRGLVVLAAMSLIWAVVVMLTGGIGFRYGPIFFSSRGPRNPLILAVLFAMLACVIAPAGAKRVALVRDGMWLGRGTGSLVLRWWRRWVRFESWLVYRIPARAPAVLAAIVAVGVVALGFKEGAFVAAGADAWGYLGQADLWAHGTLRVEQPLMRELVAGIPPDALAPLAYRALPDRMEVVPAVGPGLSLIMALFQIVGGRDAAFYVLPLSAGVAIIAAYLIALRIAGRWSGLAAAGLLTASPSFLFQLTSSPMSDIPAAAWWGLSLASALRESRRAALGAGLAAGAAVLTRPNLAPLVAIPGALFLWEIWRERSVAGPSTQRFVVFAAGITPFVAAIAALNAYWYGSPFDSGYGSLGDLYQWTNAWPNLTRYPRWLIESQTPLVLLAFAAPFLVRQRARATMLVVFACAVLACYVTYIPFDAWWFLRFLLPAYPPLLALTAVALVSIASRVPAGMRVVTAALVVGLTVHYCVAYATARATFLTEGEQKYAIAGRYVAEHLPERAVLFTMQHSGSVRYYSGRVTLRWDRTPVDKLDWTVAEIERRGYVPYALVEDWEDDMWRELIGARTVLPALTRPPIATLPLGNVRIYDLRSAGR